MNKITQYLLISFLTLFSIDYIAQQLNSSPYTRYGLGEITTKTNATYFGMGNASVSLSEINHVNLSNPASYAGFIQYKPVFDVGSFIRVQQLSSQNGKVNKKTVSLRNFALGLPIGKRSGAAFGLTPYSTVGYDMNSYGVVEGDSVRYNYKGIGGLNRVFVGFARQIINKGDSNVVSLGLNSSYIFGTIENNRSVIFNNSNLYNSKVNNFKTFSGFNFDVGLHYKYKKNKNLTLQFGIDYTLNSSLSLTKDFYAYNFKYKYVVVEESIDTVEYAENIKGKVNLPSQLKIGFSALINNKLTLSLQYDKANWKNYKETIEGTTTTLPEMVNQSKITLGMSYTPTPMREWNNKSRSVFNKSTYRFGIWTSNSNIKINQTQIKDNGISFGVSAPLLSSRTFSSADVGVQLGQYGTISNGLVQDRYIKIYIGFSLAPTNYDRWFRKRKYD